MTARAASGPVRPSELGAEGEGSTSSKRAALGVTPTAQVTPAGLDAAHAVAARLGLPFVHRRRKASLDPLLRSSAERLLVVGEGTVALTDSEGTFRFSAGVAELRIRRLDAGEGWDDGMLRATKLRPGECVLDATLGLGQDARVAARAVGRSGKVVGLEASLPLWALTTAGLGMLPPHPESCPVETLNVEATAWLRRAPPGSFDVVMIDPMFERPGKGQPAFEEGLRRLAHPAPLDAALMEAARRVARRAVAVKCSVGSDALVRLGVPRVSSSPHARVWWGRLDAG